MTTAEYEAYKEAVAEFMAREGIDNLTRAVNDAEPFFSWVPCECCGSTLGGDRIVASGSSHTPPHTVHTYAICTDCEYYAEYGRLDDTTMMGMTP